MKVIKLCLPPSVPSLPDFPQILCPEVTVFTLLQCSFFTCQCLPTPIVLAAELLVSGILLPQGLQGSQDQPFLVASKLCQCTSETAFSEVGQAGCCVALIPARKRLHRETLSQKQKPTPPPPPPKKKSLHKTRNCSPSRHSWLAVFPCQCVKEPENIVQLFSDMLLLLLF